MGTIEATIALKGRSPAGVRALDLYGVPAELRVPVMGGAFTIDGRRTC